jgi:UDPglucose 6-dehydrogenase
MTDAINNYHKTDRICNLLLEYMKERDTKELSILGLSYKEDTPIIEESVSISVIKVLWGKGVSFKVYDPIAMENTERELEDYNRIFYSSSMYDCIDNAAVCFIATPWNEFVNLNPQAMVKRMKKNAIILDAWGMLSYGIAKHRGKKIEVRQLGRNYQ